MTGGSSSCGERACVRPARILVEKPCVVFWVSLSVALLMAAIPLLAYDMFEIDFTTDYFQVRGNDVANKYNAIELATRPDGLHHGRRAQETQGNWCHNFVDLFFQTVDGGDIFTVARIAEAHQKQEALQQMSGISRVAFSTLSALSDMGESELAAAVHELASANSNDNWAAWDYWTQDCPEGVQPGREICDPPDGHHRTWADAEGGPSAYFSRNFSTCDPTTSVIRVKLEVCTGDGDPASRSDLYDQIAMLNDDSGKGAEVRLVWRDPEFDSWQQETQMGKEAVWLAAVMVVVFVLIFLQTRSFFVTAMGFLEVILSFPMGYFFYRVIAGVQYFHFLNLLGLFIMLGIGADDIFVLNDAWAQSAILFPRGNLEQRMHWTISKSSRSIFITSFTTAVAFLGNLVSDIPPLRFFGLMTGAQVISDFVLTCTFLASGLVIKAKYIDKQHEVTGCVENTSTTRVAAVDTAVDILPTEPSAVAAPLAAVDTVAAAAKLPDNGVTDVVVAGEWRPIEKFFATKYGPFMTRHGEKVLLVCCIWLAVTINVAPLLNSQKEDPSLWPRSHNQYIAKEIETKVIPAKSYPIMVNVVHGIIAKQTSMDPLSHDDEILEYDASFDMSQSAAQVFMLDTCDALTSAQNLVRMVDKCWLYSFRSYVSSRYSGGAVRSGTCEGGPPVGFPVPTAQFRDAIACFREHDDRAREYFEDYESFIDLDDSGNVRFSRIRVWSKIAGGESVTDLQDVYTQWEGWMQERNDKARQLGLPLDNAFQLDANGKFMQMSTIDSLQSGFTTAASLSISLACAVILLTTANVLITLYAIGTVVAIVLSMITLMVWGGFLLGVLESMCLAILVGVSIDYTLHLALAYQETNSQQPRSVRATTAAQHMGISIVSGAVSTASSGILLFFTTITFFTLFGYFIVTTAVLSVLLASTLFMSLLYTVGPEGDAGALAAGFKCLRCQNRPSPRRTTAEVVPGAGTEPAVEVQALTPASNQVGHLTPEAVEPEAVSPIRLTRGNAYIALAVGVVLLAIIIRISTSSSSDPTGCEPGYIDLMFASGHHVSSEETSYVCMGLDLPTECTMHATKFEVLKNVDEMHHILVLKAVSNLGWCPFSCFDMPEVTGFIWAWAVGGSALELPPGVGISLGGTSDAPSVLLQIHYDNYQRKTDLIDPGSGVRVHYGVTAPPRTATVIGVGGAPLANFEIPPQTTSYTVVMSSPMEDLTGEIEVFAWALHGHTLMRRGRMEHFRAGEFLGIIGCMGYNAEYGTQEDGIQGCTTQPYLFDFQRTIDITDASRRPTIRPNDELRVYCEFNSMDRFEPTRSGFASDQEMCQVYLYATPGEHVTQNFVFMNEPILVVNDDTGESSAAQWHPIG